MNKTALYTGLATAAVLGGAVSMMAAGPMAKNHKLKTAKKQVSRTLHSVGTIVDNLM
ncbi:MAG: hypothetical protein ACOX7F_08495 [Eubacteriales bacterium]|jgi:hypothetical protein